MNEITRLRLKEHVKELENWYEGRELHRQVLQVIHEYQLEEKRQERTLYAD